jgi:hypothetical protein
VIAHSAFPPLTSPKVPTRVAPPRRGLPARQAGAPRCRGQAVQDCDDAVGVDRAIDFDGQCFAGELVDDVEQFQGAAIGAGSNWKSIAQITFGRIGDIAEISLSMSNFLTRPFSASSSLSHWASLDFIPPYCGSQRCHVDSATSRCRHTASSSWREARSLLPSVGELADDLVLTTVEI